MIATGTPTRSSTTDRMHGSGSDGPSPSSVRVSRAHFAPLFVSWLAIDSRVLDRHGEVDLTVIRRPSLHVSSCEHTFVWEKVVGMLSKETLALQRLEDEITELAAHIHAATCRWLCLVAEYDRREGWALWGAKSCAHWLAWTCGIAPGAAREHVRVARRLPELPA